MFLQPEQEIEVIYGDGDGDCIVCGATHSSCVGENTFDGTVRFAPPKPPNDPAATFTVPERIFEERQEGNRTVRSLVYAKGARIRPEEAKRLGLLKDV